MDSYDEEFDYNYEEDEYADAVDDWEAEAEAEDEKLKAEEEARQARLEKKLATRAPVKIKEVVETAVPADIEKAMSDMRQMANDIASGDGLLSGGSQLSLIGNQTVSTEEEAGVVGKLIAERLLSFSDSANFSDLMSSVFKQLAVKLTDMKVLTSEADRVHRHREVQKRLAKTKAKPVATAVVKEEGMNLDNFEDRGGAAVASENEDETGW